MTKKDLNALAVGTAVGGGLFALFWFFLRGKQPLRELLPTEVKWEGH